MVAHYEPADGFHVGEYLKDELAVRGWSVADCAMRMPGDFATNHLALEFTIAMADFDGDPMKYVDCTIGDELASGLEVATGISAECWLNLEAEWKRWARKENQ